MTSSGTLPGRQTSNHERASEPQAVLPDGAWIVIPAYNEAPRIEAVLRRVLEVCRNVAVVDDAATDDTAERVRRYPVWLLRHPMNLGQGAALQTGISFALSRGADYVITFDADGQHQVEDLPRLLGPLREGTAHYALGSRFLGQTQGIPISRKLVLHAARLFTWVLSGLRLSDVHNGLKAMTREGASRIRLTCNRMEHASEILDQIRLSGLPFVEVPVTIRYTAETLQKGQQSSAAISMATRLVLEKFAR